MAGRMSSLMNAEPKTVRDGAVTVVDPLTVKLVLNAPDITLIAGWPTIRPPWCTSPTRTAIRPRPRHRPYLPESVEIGVKVVLVKNANHTWWGTAAYGGPYLDKIEYIDLGTDPAAEVAAAGSGEIDATYQSVGEFIDVLDGLGWTKSEAVTSATLAVRFNQLAEEYKDVNVRNGLIKCVDNKVVLELGYSNLGTVAENHHVCPIHPEYFALPPLWWTPPPARPRSMPPARTTSSSSS